MAFDPASKPKEVLTVVIAAGLFIFRASVFSASEAFKAADEFVAETEKRTGKLNP